VRLAHAVKPRTKLDKSKVSSLTDGVVVSNGDSALPVSGDALNSLEVASLGSKKITSFFGSSPLKDSTPASDGLSLTPLSDSQSVIAIPIATAVCDAPGPRNPVAVNPTGLADPKSTVFRIAASFDFVVRLVGRSIEALSESQCLILQMKSAKKQYLLYRLKFLRFLVDLMSIPKNEALPRFVGSEFYDIFECNWLFRAKDIDSSNTRGDGYCFSRGKAQLKFREASDFKVDVKEMKAFDSKNNSIDVDNTNAEFSNFISDLPSLLKDESLINKPLITQMGELTWFKHKKQLEIMPSLLALRGPGSHLGEQFWGDLSTITMLGFNVTCVSKLVGDDFVSLISKNRQSWVKYEASSVPIARDRASIQRSLRPLIELDQVVGQELNLLYYYKPHFCVIGNPSRVEFEKSFLDIKSVAFGMLLDRVNFAVKMVPDFCDQLRNLIERCDGKSGSANFEDFPTGTFEQKFLKKFPDARVGNGAMFDLTLEDEEADETLEVFRLKQALDLTNSKVCCCCLWMKVLLLFPQLKVVEDFNAVLRHECLIATARKN
jgi:hypothetical protein